MHLYPSFRHMVDGLLWILHLLLRNMLLIAYATMSRIKEISRLLVEDVTVPKKEGGRVFIALSTKRKYNAGTRIKKLVP